MAAPSTKSGEDAFVVAIFHNAAAFEGALEALIAIGIDRGAISILANHDMVRDHFGDIPEAGQMADRPDTPREDLDTQGALRAAINFIAESAAAVGEIGAAAMAYAVGGPVGVASATSTLVNLNVGDMLSGYVARQYHGRFERSVRDGGVICWVHVRQAGRVREIIDLLTDKGGENAHSVEPGAPSAAGG